MPLDAFLVMPVQRVPRYRLLLEELLKAVEGASEETTRTALLNALRDVKAIAAKINSMTKRMNPKGGDGGESSEEEEEEAVAPSLPGRPAAKVATKVATKTPKKKKKKKKKTAAASGGAAAPPKPPAVDTRARASYHRATIKFYRIIMTGLSTYFVVILICYNIF